MRVQSQIERVIRLSNGSELVDREADGLTLRRIDLDGGGTIQRVHSIPVDPNELIDAIALMTEEPWIRLVPPDEAA